MFQLVMKKAEIKPIDPKTQKLGARPWKRTVIDEMKIATARTAPRPNFFDSVVVRIPPKTAPDPAPARSTPKY
jgi:hypothetical protein